MVQVADTVKFPPLTQKSHRRGAQGSAKRTSNPSYAKYQYFMEMHQYSLQSSGQKIV